MRANLWRDLKVRAYTVYIDMHSGLLISEADPRPMYLQIKEQVRHLVAVGQWRPGQEIPSIRALAVSVRVSVITVKRAYLELEREGVIVTQHGKGSFVAQGVQLPTSLQEQQLDEHLAAATRIGRMLGLTDEQLASRLRKAERLGVKKKA
jgi:GntR family transcriptional regulator